MPSILTAPTDQCAPEPLLTRRDLEHLLQVGDRTLRRWAASGVLPRPVKLGGVNRWHREDVRHFLAKLAVPEPPAATPVLMN